MLKAIETEYSGYRFRSRLEARWAVFFNYLGIPWQYEPEGFDLNGLYYLPDFWLPAQQCWYEVKGSTPTAEEQEKAARLAKQSGFDVVLAFGSVGDYPGDGFWIYRGGDATFDNLHSWCVPSENGGPGRSRVDPMPQYDLRFESNNYRRDEFEWTMQLAYNEAKQARFEHGAQP